MRVLNEQKRKMSVNRVLLILLYFLLLVVVGLVGWSWRNAFLPHTSPLNPSEVTLWAQFPAQSRLDLDVDNGCVANALCAAPNFTQCFECHPTKRVFSMNVWDNKGHATQSLYFGARPGNETNSYKFGDNDYELHLSLANGAPLVAAWPGRTRGTLSMVVVKLENSIGLPVAEIVVCACLTTAVLVELGVLVLLSFVLSKPPPTRVWLQ